MVVSWRVIVQNVSQVGRHAVIRLVWLKNGVCVSHHTVSAQRHPAKTLHGLFLTCPDNLREKAEGFIGFSVTLWGSQKREDLIRLRGIVSVNLKHFVATLRCPSG